MSEQARPTYWSFSALLTNCDHWSPGNRVASQNPRYISELGLLLPRHDPHPSTGARGEASRGEAQGALVLEA
jgi:hypothetical protein